MIPTERGPDVDWHGSVTQDPETVIHRTFVTREETEKWVYSEMKLRGVSVRGTIAQATTCPMCKRN